jgi:hypothetical protein
MNELVRRTIVSSVLWCGAIACLPQASKVNSNSYRLRFQVRTGQGVAVSGARIWVDSASIGVTAAQGIIATQFHGREGQEVKVKVQCPNGYRGTELDDSVRLAKTRALDDTVEQLGTLVELTCDSDLRDVIVVVNVKGGGLLPVRVGTQSAGVTDAQGNAQLLVHLDRENTGIEIGIDTESRRELLPRNPSRSFSIGQNDAIVVYSERLIVTNSKPKGNRLVKRKSVPSAPEPAPRPIRLE